MLQILVVLQPLLVLPPNLVLAGIVEESGLGPIGFADWLFFCISIVFILFVVVYVINTTFIYPIKKSRNYPK